MTRGRTRIQFLLESVATVTTVTVVILAGNVNSFEGSVWRRPSLITGSHLIRISTHLNSTPNFNSDNDANRWSSSDEEELNSRVSGFGGATGNVGDDETEPGIPIQDWEEMLKQRENPNTWSSFESAAETDLTSVASKSSSFEDLEDQSEIWLNTLQSISAQEVEFNLRENERADKVRQMQEWGFTAESIQGALGVAVDDKYERESDETYAALIDEFRQAKFGMMTVDDDLDLRSVESHTRVELDEETGEPIRSQMVYVDEHTCIGCTNCATVAPSTFFMEDSLGRARVYQQWGNNDETIKIAIETCPVDCIHYVPYEELVSLEIQRRTQFINFKARLVSQAEYGGGQGHRVGGPSIYTDAPKISGNLKSRCNNCPSAGCRTCPMYGVGENLEFKRKEELRERRRKEKLRQQAMESLNKRAEL